MKDLGEVLERTKIRSLRGIQQLSNPERNFAMTTKQATPVVTAPAVVSHKLAPTITSKAKAKTVAAADGRKRPIVAINEEGKLVVCCRRTAKKNGWDIQEVLYERTKTMKVEASVVPAPKTERRTGDAAKTAKVKKAKAVVDAALDDILGK